MLPTVSLATKLLLQFQQLLVLPVCSAVAFIQCPLLQPPAAPTAAAAAANVFALHALLLSPCLKLYDLLCALLIQYPVSTLTTLNRLSWLELGAAPAAATDIVAC